jgi:hypothetical protein
LQKITYRMAEKGEGTEVTLLRSLDMRELQDEGRSMITKLADDLAKVCLFFVHCFCFFVFVHYDFFCINAIADPDPSFISMIIRIEIRILHSPTLKKRTRIAIQFLGLKLPFSYFLKIDYLQLKLL